MLQNSFRYPKLTFNTVSGVYLLNPSGYFMIKTLFLQILIFFVYVSGISQSVTNKGKDFWVGYGPANAMGVANGQDMTLYLSVESLPVGMNYATVTVSIDSSGLVPSLWWKRVYHIPANTIQDISSTFTPAFSYSPVAALADGPLPKGSVTAGSHTSTSFDCRLYSDPCPVGNGGLGIFRKKGVHITSDVDIVAYAHTFGGVSSGATMLLPTNSWGYSYTTMNSYQANQAGSNSFNYFFVMAKEDSTRIKITASQAARTSASCTSAPPLLGTFFIVELQKGQIYQYTGQADASGNGVELTGSKIESIPNASGIKKSIAVFAGTAGTSGENSGTCSGTSRDLDIQQCFPENSWGKRYATVPFATASGTNINPSIFAETVYKIVAKDTNTLVTINGAAPIMLSIGTAYKFSNTIPNFIQANKPIMVGQFMTSENCGSGDGDPEMIYLSPLEQAVSQVGFYRNTQQAINTNYVSIIIPDSGLASLKIDAYLANSANNTYIISHPNFVGYKIVVKGWPAAKAQCLIKSNAPFNAITYGLGVTESYGYNCGASFENINQYFDISGRIVSTKLKPVKNAFVIPTNSTNYSDTSGGYYVSTNSNNYTIRPTKNNDITKANGVTSVDVLLTQRHILNTTKLNSAYKLIAADVDGNKAINSVDILRMKRLILGTDTTFTSSTKGNRLWEFVDSAYQFPDTTNPFPFKDSISFTNLTSNKINQTFIGVKLGDVNYDWNAAVAKGSSIDNVELIIDNADIKVDKQLSTVYYQLPIKVNNFKDIAAMQYTLHFDNTKYEFVNLEGFKNLQGFEYNANQANKTGNISFLWTDKTAEAKTLEDGTELFTLVVKHKTNYRSTNDFELAITNAITAIEAWDKDFNQHNIVLTKRETINEQQETRNESFSVSPNPTSGEIKVNIASKINKTVNFELTDAQGKAILKQSVELQKGNNSFTLNLKQNSNITTGVYFLKAVGIEGDNVKRIMIK